MATYSFQDYNCTLVGPTGTISLGSGAGNADEGVVVSMIEDKNTMVVGADGTPMHSLHAGKGSTVSVHLQKTSPVNQLLSVMYNLQTASSVLHGKNVISMRNIATGDIISTSQCAFKKLPDNMNGKDAGSMVWVFDAGITDQILGGGNN